MLWRSNSQKEGIVLVTWNISDFGITKDSDELAIIAKEIRHADVVAIQEIVTNINGEEKIRDLISKLKEDKSNWNYTLSKATSSPGRSTESYAFLWKESKLKMARTRLIFELDSLIDREPYLITLATLRTRFNIISIHTRPQYTGKTKKEILALGNLPDSIVDIPTFVLGDFNLNQKDSAFTLLKQRNFFPVLSNEETMLAGDCNGSIYLGNSFDNIFYSSDIKVYDFRVIDYVQNCERFSMADSISDHLPVEVFFSLN